MSTVHTLPHPNCYWIPGSRVIAGEFPNHPDPEKGRARIRSMLDAGVTTFIDLTQETEFMTPYYPVLLEEARGRGVEVMHHRFPIVDNDVPTPERMAEILDCIAAAEGAGHTVYVHCWGGVGRTGTVVGCYLVRSGLSGADALAKVGALFSTMSAAKTHKHRHTGSPQTGAQRDFVRSWAGNDSGMRGKIAAARRAAEAVEGLLAEYGSARSALRAVEEQEERDRRELSVVERMSGPLGAQAVRAEILRRLRALAAQEPERTAEAKRELCAGGTPSEHSDDPTDEEGEEFEIDIDAILRELDAEPGFGTPTLLPVICTALDERGFKYVLDERSSRISFHLKGDEAMFECYLSADEERRVVQCYVREPLWVPEEARVAMCEVIVRANYGLPVGNFEMDMNDGEVRFKTSMDVEGGDLVPTMVDNLVGAGITTSNRYHAAFMRVIYGGISPRQAIEEAEN